MRNSSNIIEILSEESNFDFRNTRWEFSKERVLLAERGNPVFFRSDNVLIYKCKIEDVPCQLIYTFNNNKLRSAGFITLRPVKNADALINDCIEKLGEPEMNNTSMTWRTPDSVIYANAYKIACYCATFTL